MNRDLKDYRVNYKQDFLTEKEMHANPFKMFKQWFQVAEEANILEPNAMTLATSDLDGKPSARIVLLKGIDEGGFIFYTNYESRKGKQLLSNPYASLVFLWKEIERQVNICGSVEKITEKESEAYFHSRPRESQIGAWTSPQSQIISDRSVLEDRKKKYIKKFADIVVPLPPHWGGFRVIPDSIEFWQGRPSRLHDRLKYVREEEEWEIVRLAP